MSQLATPDANTVRNALRKQKPERARDRILDVVIAEVVGIGRIAKLTLLTPALERLHEQVSLHTDAYM